MQDNLLLSAKLFSHCIHHQLPARGYLLQNFDESSELSSQERTCFLIDVVALMNDLYLLNFIATDSGEIFYISQSFEIQSPARTK